MAQKKYGKKIRYGVVGLGHIAQTAILPGFANAKKNSELVALISQDEEKLEVLAKEYKVPLTYKYDELEECLKSGAIDALYVATPNDLHKVNVELAAKYNVHILCEKPMAVTAEECRRMEKIAHDHKVFLMIAYRLHFESANLEAIKLCRDEKIGELKFFNSIFSFQIDDKKNIRLGPQDLGGGPIYDIGVYCINAARYLFQSEPVEVSALATSSRDARFNKTDENTSVILRFPGGRIANFTVSFGSYDSSEYDIVGSTGRIRLENAYDYAQTMKLRLTQEGKKEKIKEYKKRDQFSAEMIYFSDCILNNKKPEPSGLEGLADVKVIEAINKSLETGRAISLEPVHKTVRPSKRQEITKHGIKKGKTIHVTSPTKR